MDNLKFRKIIKIISLIIGFGIFHIIIQYYPSVFFWFVVSLAVYVLYVTMVDRFKNKQR